METWEDEFILSCELHDPEHLRSLITRGFDLRQPIRDKLPVHWLTEMYTRSDRFSACLEIMLNAGALLQDPHVTAVLLNDGTAIFDLIRANPSLLNHQTSMTSAFTPLLGATLLHVAAEFGHLEAAQALIELGADVNTPAGLDDDGMGGHTPLFHVVNSNGNRSLPILRHLLAAGAEVDIHLSGLVWGRGFDWETTLLDLTPISYAQFGLLPQMHRRECDIYDNIRLLTTAAGRRVPTYRNVPNRYLYPPGAKG